ncbi:unnamed protein product [Nippostrongylus brasiliensis]|uniref:Reverse transcriptase domain-containing protein n=1 Tax=Nippostrongylus brasiliensis TaxID=27835 RepID=A0A0N4YD08_NIPBR|nr:unnamed protein product [Nippostrongylus brasiliensis]
MYARSRATIRTPHGNTKKVAITVGVHQGSALSPFLFLLTLDSMVRHLTEDPLKTILYADDMALIADSREELQDKVQQWQETLAKNCLRLNVKKTKFMSSEDGSEPILDCYRETIERVNQFRYLGSELSRDGAVDEAVRGRINAAWVKWREATGILRDKRCSRVLKGKLYRAVVRPAVLYGSECWPTNKAHERQVHSAEMRMLRWACGWTRMDRVRNEDLRSVMGVAPVHLKMREQRLRWYGHILRRGQPNKKSIGVRSTRQASMRSAQKKMERRHHKRPQRGQLNIRRRPG